jgi:hypothetical protein
MHQTRYTLGQTLLWLRSNFSSHSHLPVLSRITPTNVLFVIPINLNVPVKVWIFFSYHQAKRITSDPDKLKNQHSAVDVMTGTGVDSRQGQGNFLFTASILALGPHCAMGAKVSSLLLKRARMWKPSTHLHLLPRSRTVEIHSHSPVCFHGVVLG